MIDGGHHLVNTSYGGNVADPIQKVGNVVTGK